MLCQKEKKNALQYINVEKMHIVKYDNVSPTKHTIAPEAPTETPDGMTKEDNKLLSKPDIACNNPI